MAYPRWIPLVVSLLLSIISFTRRLLVQLRLCGVEPFLHGTNCQFSLLSIIQKSLMICFQRDEYGLKIFLRAPLSPDTIISR